MGEFEVLTSGYVSMDHIIKIASPATIGCTSLVTNKNNVQEQVISEEQMQNEFDYMIAQQMLKNMLEKGMISLAEFDKISALNLEIFSPELASIMA